MKGLYKTILYLLILAVISSNSNPVFCQKDTIPNIIKVWEIDFLDMSVDSSKIDTGMMDLQSRLPQFSENYYTLSNGNYGLPFSVSKATPFYYNKSNPFSSSIKGYMFTSENQFFYNTRKPLSSIDFVNSGSKAAKSQVLTVFHTQNINPFFNAGFRVFYNHSLGDYKRQEVKNTSIGFWSSYQKNKYELFASLNYNKYRTQENGGFENDSLFNSGIFDDSKYIEVNLQDASSTNYYFEIDLVHAYSLLPKDSLSNEKLIKDFRLVHNSKLSKSARAYDDNDPSSGFYQSIFIDSLLTIDSVGINSFYNYIYLEGKSKNEFLNIQAGIFNSIQNYSHLNLDSSVINYGLKGGLDFSIGNLMKGEFKTSYIISGDYSGEQSSNVSIYRYLHNSPKSPRIGLTVASNKEAPRLFLNNYFSNNFIWNNEFYQTNSSRVEANISWAVINTNISIKTESVENYLYFNENAVPRQHKDKITNFSAELNSSVPLRNFNLGANLLYQTNDNNDIIPIPELNVKGSVSYSTFMFNKALQIGFGTDIYYFTSYYAPAYMPAIGVYYNQSKKEIGDYPYIDLYLKAKIRNFRLLLKYHHINDGLTNQSYYSAYNMASPPRRFTFGISWMFYD